MTGIDMRTTLQVESPDEVGRRIAGAALMTSVTRAGAAAS